MAPAVVDFKKKGSDIKKIPLSYGKIHLTIDPWKIKRKRALEAERERAGRKKTTTKCYGFQAPEAVEKILESVPGKTEYIIQAILEKYEREKGRDPKVRLY